MFLLILFWYHNRNMQGHTLGIIVTFIFYWYHVNAKSHLQIVLVTYAGAITKIGYFSLDKANLQDISHKNGETILWIIYSFNSSPSGLNGRYFTDDFVKCTLWIKVFSTKIVRKFVSKVSTQNESALAKAVAWRRTGYKSQYLNQGGPNSSKHICGPRDFFFPFFFFFGGGGVKGMICKHVKYAFVVENEL